MPLPLPLPLFHGAVLSVPFVPLPFAFCRAVYNGTVETVYVFFTFCRRSVEDTDEFG